MAMNPKVSMAPAKAYVAIHKGADADVDIMHAAMRQDMAAIKSRTMMPIAM